MTSLSQMQQDVFAYHLLKKQPGYFVDLGCGDGFSTPDGNNTFLLEKNQWNGIGVDIKQEYIETYNKNRKTLGVCADVTKHTIEQILNENNAPQVIDYLSFDVDEGTECALRDLNLETYKFKFITFEHNSYLNSRGLYLGLKEAAKKKFLNAGYCLFIEDVLHEPCPGPVEDWYIHPDYLHVVKRFTNIHPKNVLHLFETND